MREERGKLNGDFTINELFTLWGMIVGTVTVVEGGRLYIRGSIYGDLVVENGGRVHIFGNVQGNVTVAEDAKIIHSGVVGGDIINRGGRVFVELTAKVMGKVKTKDGGKTTFEPKPRAIPE